MQKPMAVALTERTHGVLPLSVSVKSQQLLTVELMVGIGESPDVVIDFFLELTGCPSRITVEKPESTDVGTSRSGSFNNRVDVRREPEPVAQKMAFGIELVSESMDGEEPVFTHRTTDEDRTLGRKPQMTFLGQQVSQSRVASVSEDNTHATLRIRQSDKGYHCAFKK